MAMTMRGQTTCLLAERVKSDSFLFFLLWDMSIFVCASNAVVNLFYTYTRIWFGTPQAVVSNGFKGKARFVDVEVFIRYAIGHAKNRTASK